MDLVTPVKYVKKARCEETVCRGRRVVGRSLKAEAHRGRLARQLLTCVDISR